MSAAIRKATEMQQATEQLLIQVRGAIANTDRFFLDQGLDPAQARSVLSSYVTGDIADEISAEFETALRDIKQDVDKRKAEIRPGQDTAGKGPKRPRAMV